MSGRDQDWDEGTPVPTYVITGGRSRPDMPLALDLVTLIVAQSVPQPGMQPEAAAILRLCQSPLAVAEISAYLSLPISVINVLLADLLDSGLVEARGAHTVDESSATSHRVNINLLEDVIRGLRALPI